MAPAELVKRNVPATTTRKGVAGRTHAAAATGDSEGCSKLEGTEAIVKVMPYVATSLLGAFLFGYHVGIVNGALQFLAADIGIATNTFLQGLVVSMTLAGAFLGAVVGGSMNDAYGRCRSFQLSSVPLVVGGLMCAFANTATFMIVGRLLCGLGIGLTSCVVPVYISEVAPTAVRGALGSFNQLCICVGIFAALLAGLPLANNPSWWRQMFLMSAVPGGLLGVLAAVIPESPRWLYKQGDKAGAVAAAKRLWGGYDDADLGADEEGGGQGGDVSWPKVLSGSNLKLVSIGFFLFMLQQMTGVNAVVYFSSSVFREAGVVNDVAASAAVALVNVLATVLSGSVIDKLGRKPLMTGSLIGMAVSMLTLAAAMTVPALAPVKGLLCVVMTMTYIGSFGFGMGPIPSLLVSEILPNSLRGKGASVAMMSHWGFNFLIGQAFLEANRMFGVASIYAFFASVCLMTIVFVQTQVVETKGKTLEEIQKAMLNK